MTGDTNTPCTAHRAVQLAFANLGWNTGGVLTHDQIVGFAATRNRTSSEVDRVLARQVRLGRIIEDGRTYKQILIPMTTRELRAVNPDRYSHQSKLGGVS